MADNSDTTPFLADNDHGDNYDETEHHITKKSPANAHFKLPIKILTIIISVLSLSICGILIGSYVFINTGPFQYTYGSSESIRDLAICVGSSNSHIYNSIQPEFPPHHLLKIIHLALRNPPRHRPHHLPPTPHPHQHRHQHRNVNRAPHFL
jgi:hypothetical protein